MLQLPPLYLFFLTVCPNVNKKKPNVDIFMFQVLKYLLYFGWFLLPSSYTDMNFSAPNLRSLQSYCITTSVSFVIQCSFPITSGIVFQISQLVPVLPSFSYHLDFIWVNFEFPIPVYVPNILQVNFVSPDNLSLISNQ